MDDQRHVATREARDALVARRVAREAIRRRPGTDRPAAHEGADDRRNGETMPMRPAASRVRFGMYVPTDKRASMTNGKR